MAEARSGGKSVPQLVEELWELIRTYLKQEAVDPLKGLLPEDLRWMVHRATTGFMFTKVHDERDIVYFDRLLTQSELDLAS